jgi:hypothetical protein
MVCKKRGAKVKKKNKRATEFLGISIPQHPQHIRDERLQFLSGNDLVQKTVFQDEFGGLEAFGEVLSDGFFDDAWTGEADQSARFGDVQVAQHGVTKP